MAWGAVCGWACVDPAYDAYCQRHQGCDAATAEDSGGPPDGGTPDAGGTDAGGTDAGRTDAGTSDAGPTDAGSTDAGSRDAGGTDAGGTDAGPTDAGGADAGATDAGSGFALYLTAPSAGGYGLDTTPPIGSGSSVALNAAGLGGAWGSLSTTSSVQSFDSTTRFQFVYWATGNAGATASASLVLSQTSSATCGPGVAHLQSQVVVGSGNQTQLSASFPGAVAAGDLLVGVFRGQGTVTISDNVNGSWAQAAQQGDAYLYYREGSAGGAVTVTLQATTASGLRIALDEFSGVLTSGSLDPASVTTNASSNGATTWSAGTSSAISAGELVYAGATCSNPSILFTAGSSDGQMMSLGVAQGTNDGSIFSEYVLSSAAGPQDSSAFVTPGAGMHGGQAAFRLLATPIATLSTPLSAGAGMTTPTFSPPGLVSIPAGQHLCWTVHVTQVTGSGVTLDYGGASSPSQIQSNAPVSVR